MINLNIDLTEDDKAVLSLMDYSEEDYLDYGSYSFSVECKSFDVEENIRDGIADGDATEEDLNIFKDQVKSLVTKIKKSEGAN
jgi:hypothetical protein